MLAEVNFVLIVGQRSEKCQESKFLIGPKGCKNFKRISRRSCYDALRSVKSLDNNQSLNSRNNALFIAIKSLLYFSTGTFRNGSEVADERMSAPTSSPQKVNTNIDGAPCMYNAWSPNIIGYNLRIGT